LKYTTNAHSSTVHSHTRLGLAVNRMKWWNVFSQLKDQHDQVETWLWWSSFRDGKSRWCKP